jgi:hypothetical protein
MGPRLRGDDTEYDDDTENVVAILRPPPFT